MAEFATFAQQQFAFLIDDFGFTLTARHNPVRFEADRVYVEVSFAQGEVDLCFGVKVDTDILRPYVSHRFSLAQVVRYYKRGAFPSLSSLSTPPGLTEAERAVMHLARLTKTYCADILRGDITPLERISENPGAKHSEDMT